MWKLKADNLSFRRWQMAALSMLLAFFSSAWANEDAPKILILGDSLSAAYGIQTEQGWVALLNQRLEKQGYVERVANASISGETTAGGMRRLPRLLKKHKPEIVVIELGANDGLRGQPLEQMRKNLTLMTEMSQEQGAKVVILGMRLPPNYGPEYAAEFHDSFEMVATEVEAAYLPFFLDGIALDRSLFQEDGIHPNAIAQKKLLHNVWPLLKPLLKAPDTELEEAA